MMHVFSARLRSSLAFLPFCLAPIVPATLPSAYAQAIRTASKSNDISVFGGFEYADPAYGPSKNSGGVLGFDFTHYLLHFPVQPSLEARANFNSGTYASEHSYLFGLRGMYPLGRIKPYADFLVGPGNIHFPLNIGYIGDNSLVYNYGGGVDLGFTRNFSLKLDIQGQRWNTGEIRFAPTIGTVGISYTIPFRPHIRQRDFYR